MKGKVRVQVWVLGRGGTGSQHQLPAAAVTSRPTGVPLSTQGRTPPYIPVLYLSARPSQTSIRPRLSRINAQTYAVILATLT